MKPFLLSLFIFLFFVSCGNRYPKAEDPLDAGREFIDATLKGDFEKAKAYMLRNETNDKDFEKMVSEYRQKGNEQKQQYHDASITILEEDAASDSVHIINYKNSFDGIARKVKVANTQNSGWLVDLSYTFSGNL